MSVSTPASFLLCLQIENFLSTRRTPLEKKVDLIITQGWTNLQGGRQWARLLPSEVNNIDHLITKQFSAEKGLDTWKLFRSEAWECDKALKASTWPPNPPDPWTFEHSGGIPDSSATHQSTDLWGCPVLFGTRALVVNPLSPVGLEVRPPWNRLIPVRPTVVGQTDIWGIWRPCGRLEVVCTFSGRCWSVFAALHRTGWQEGSCRHCWCFISSFVLLKI